jgi:hypothetical protein
MIALAAWVLFAAPAALPSAAGASPPPLLTGVEVVPPRPRRARSAGAGRSPAPSAPAPAVAFDLRATARSGPWTVRVANEGDVPVRLLADTRLLSFDLTGRGERRPFHCELPAAMTSDDPLVRAVVLPPHRAFVEVVDPRLYCFSTAGLAALAPGAIVVAHLGGRGNPATVAPLDDVQPPVAPLRSLQSQPIALPDDPTPEPGATTEPQTDPALPTADSAKLTLGAPLTVDAPTAQDITIPLTLRNEGSSPVIVRFRPDSVGFDVSRPGMSQRCVWPAVPTSPSRDLYATVPAHGSVDLTIVLTAYCHGDVLAWPGLIAVRPWLDTRFSSGRALGIRSFDGIVIASRPTLVRLQHTSTPVPVTEPALVDIPLPH